MAAEEPVVSVWTRPRRRREQPALSRAQIVAAALELLDAEGLEALSMRTLGARLDAAATSLYRHVANKDELLELVVDEVYGQIEVPEIRDGDWRRAVTACAASTRAALLRHAWIASVLGQTGLAYLGPNVMRLNERMLALFETAGFRPAEADRALGAVMAYVIGTATTEAAWLTTVARSGRTEQEWIDRLRPALREATKPYPRLHALATAEGGDAETSRGDGFAYGLERMLDGLTARLTPTE
ncbi:MULTISPECIES: TetR/AcrR family transcriptional regulator [unclassified Amycolatopsis]|uniref:TetR/AcrR family transcriptional regulator n=1 Tax=unclassified Amycolatopsis TaxID=2618356 RepID=UPI002875DE87|nr:MULTISPECIES: TetR/AcrR family transcriptional regulator [unclassified Amycolatopsis]MDS0140314.1 TetR/AcrR family transcriptional regulator [Amycolatopsis sp. 505]MDS0149082.1 TetR/AcrR family transcriptional regulator [Amycolatopsis sp. CM201R]